MSLKKFIDFEKLLDDEPSCIVFETNKKQSAFLKQNTKINLYIDSEIRDILFEIYDQYPKLIIDAAGEDNVKIKDKYLKPVVDKINEEISIKAASFYKSAHYYLCYFNIENDDNGLIFLGLINKTTNKYLFLGTGGLHPFITTNDFVYDNSDGSGPFIDEIIGSSFNPYKLITTMAIYFSEFIEDKYH